MASNVVILLTLLITCVLCEQKNSLTFVIDETSSMNYELAQVKQAAKSIVDIVLNEKSSQIEDIVLVTFNDPGFSFRKRTRNAQELKQSLDDIVVGGGGNCPEMSLSGIKQALLESQPGSYLYVFTDATARDYTMFEEIKTLCQEKRSQIVFILTGDCHDSLSLKFQVYYKLAAASNGQVFRISKGEVGQVLEYVKETIKGDRTVITSQVVPPSPSWSYVEFNIDDKTEYAIVSASGSHVTLNVLDQNNKKITDYDTITTTKNVKVLKLSNIRPGLYRAQVLGSSDINVMVFGRTDFNFDYGFSDNVVNSLKFTETQPTTGTQTHVMISVKDPEHSVTVRSVEILDMKERVIATLPLTKEGELHATGKFLPPDSMFKVAVTATARSTGKPIRRIAKTPVAPIKPVTVAPEISNEEKNIKAKEGSTVDIHCRIQKGKPKPHVTWYFKQEGSEGFMLMKDRTDDTLRVTDVTAEHTGQYQCVAENSAGRAEHTIQLDVDVHPQFEKTFGSITTKEKLPVIIECKLLKGNPPPKVTWYWQPNDPTAKITVIKGTELIISSHPILRIYQVSLPSVEHRQAGQYRCVAENSVGTDEMTIQLNVLVTPEISEAEKITKAKEGSTVDIHCRIQKGNPKPHVTWYFKQEGSEGFMLMKDRTDDTLRVTDVTAEHTGQYQCVAENSAGHAEHTIQLDVDVRPQFERTSEVITTKEKLPVIIECKLLKGNPPPKVTWYWQPNDPTAKITVIKGTELIISSHPILRIYQVSLPSVEHRQAGQYRCVAENSVGTDEMTVQLNVPVAPEISDAEKIIKAKEGSIVNIHCSIRKEEPMPHVTWYFKPEGAVIFMLMRDRTGDTLRVPNATAKHTGQYQCVAENSAGRAEHTTQLDVEVHPQFEKTSGAITTKEKLPVIIECKLLKGNPPPKVTWYWQPNDPTAKITVITGPKLVNMSHPILRIYTPSVEHRQAGQYRCVAENSVGTDEMTVQLNVLAASEISNTEKIIQAKEGSTVDIYCRIRKGEPMPHVTWYFKQEGAEIFILIKDMTGDTLRVPNVTAEHMGQYQCVAENSAGRAEHTIQLDVEVHPQFQKTSGAITTKEKLPVIIECKLLKGNPPPKVTWYWQPNDPTAKITVITGTELIIMSHPILRIYQVSLPSVEHRQAGQYRCVAENSVGTDEMTIQLNVLAAPEIDNNAFSKVNVKENSTITLQCNKILNGNPKPSVRWLYKSPKSSDYVEILKHNGQKQLNNIQLKNAGYYKCETENSLGRAERVIELIVEAPPRIVFTPPTKPEYTGVEGDVVMKLPCTAVGFPTPDVTWVVDDSVIGFDKTQPRYVEDGTLFVMNPTSKQSTNNPNKSHTYECNASNKFGKAHQPYVVYISEFEDYNEADKKYGVIGLPYTINCSLPFKNPDSVRWFYNSVSMNKTGSSLHWELPTQENNGNYTCRVSDMNGAVSKTVELIFGRPPSSSTTSWQLEWSGEQLEISCSVPQIPSGKYEWYYRGEKIKEAYADALSTDLIGWGQYTCRASNPLGSLNMTYNITTNDCYIDKTLWKTRNMPILLNGDYAWLNYVAQRYIIVPKSDKLNLICQDDPPKTKTKSHSLSNSFTKFPSSRTIVATCDNEDRFLIDGTSHKLSELDCKKQVMPTIVPTNIRCLGENTQMINIGFYINEFKTVYSSCLDTKRNVPLFTIVNMRGSDSVGESGQPKGKCRQVGECCFETVQLVNSADVSFGPAEMATFRDSLNLVPYCRPNDNTTSWHDIEKQVRTLDRTTVWSGAFNYTKVDNLLVPQYLWKIVKDLDSGETVAIVHLNGQADLPHFCEDVCHESTWFAAHGSRTYCCSLKDLERHLDTRLILTDTEKNFSSITQKF